MKLLDVIQARLDSTVKMAMYLEASVLSTLLPFVAGSAQRIESLRQDSPQLDSTKSLHEEQSSTLPAPRRYACKRFGKIAATTIIVKFPRSCAPWPQVAKRSGPRSKNLMPDPALTSDEAVVDRMLKFAGAGLATQAEGPDGGFLRILPRRGPVTYRKWLLLRSRISSDAK